MNEMYSLSDLSFDPERDIVDEFRGSVAEFMGQLDFGAMNQMPPMPPPQMGAPMGGQMPQQMPMSNLAGGEMPPQDPTMIPPQAMNPNQQPQDPLSQMSPNPNLM